MIDAAQFADEPTARNSNLSPVNAKGDVLLRSVLSTMISGILAIPSFSAVFSSGVIFVSLTRSTRLSSMADKLRPKNTERIAGGASLAPSQYVFPADMMEALSRS